jgi:triphosphoribosyl-dephospho-CoA synthase
MIATELVARAAVHSGIDADDAPDPRAGAARHIASRALRGLHAELVLYPKPGLVSTRDSGAHADMTAATFMRSLASLRRYFADIARAGARAAPFAHMQRLGQDAERRMLGATRGVNTHRGAIFTLGLLAAAAGRLRAERREPTDARLRNVVGTWRTHLTVCGLDGARAASHGRVVALRYGAAGARGEAAAEFPGVFDVALPALRRALARGASAQAAQIEALFALLACVDDTNVLYRGGPQALDALRAQARAFIAAGGVFARDWLARAEALHAHCRMRGISPGGCADLLAACWFVHLLQTDA